MTEKDQDAINQLLMEIYARISLALKRLLETKHLYQSTSLIFVDLLDSIVDADTMSAEDLKQHLLGRIEAYWLTFNNRSNLQVTAPDVKLFCAKCDRLEAFNLKTVFDLLADSQENSQTIQVFALTYLCQSCKSIPEAFLVRREGLKLTLCGRAPIEHVDVPPVIPRSVQSFYRGALLAFQSGQSLAGNFMLRTVIEQWTRQATHLETAKDANQVLDAYMDSLPKDFKDRFPSMRELYAALSSDIHAASGSTDLFERAQKEIVEHFDARRLFKLI